MSGLESVFDTPIVDEIEAEKNEPSVENEPSMTNEPSIEPVESQNEEQEQVAETDNGAGCTESDSAPCEVQPQNTVISIDEETLKKITAYFETIKSLLRYSKQKDDSIERLGKDIQHYREGFSTWAFKNSILSVIDFRETCKKDLLKLEKCEFDIEKIKKFYAILQDDLAELLNNFGIEILPDNTIKYGKKEVLAISEKSCVECAKLEAIIKGVPEEKPMPEASLDAPIITDGLTLEQILDEYRKRIEKILQNNAISDTTIANSFARSKEIDELNKLNFVRPCVLRLVKIYKSVCEKRVPERDVEETKIWYGEMLETIIDELLAAMELLGVSTVYVDSDLFDTKHHKLVKVVLTDNPDDDRKIANVYTDEYEFEEKIIYQKKVDVYKYQPQGDKE